MKTSGWLKNRFLLDIGPISNTMVCERAEELHAQDGVETHEEEEEHGDIVDL